MTDPVLAIRDLDVRFGGRRVVDLEALDLAAGEIVGLVGESGSGKSLTALATLGLAGSVGAGVRGSIRLDGRELLGLPESELRHVRGKQIAMIFQSPVSAFNPVFRVGDVFVRALALHGLRRGEARERARSALREVLLAPDLLERDPHQLSGGQAQRVAIALAVALRSRILLADEPTSALDVTVQAEILELLRTLREREGIGVLFISHDLAVVAQLCDRVAVMRAGKLVEVGSTDAVVRSPADPYTRELVAAVPRLRGREAA
jgi:ABC-type glutathione transport system ATPase component